MHALPQKLDFTLPACCIASQACSSGGHRSTIIPWIKGVASCKLYMLAQTHSLHEVTNLLIKFYCVGRQVLVQKLSDLVPPQQNGCLAIQGIHSLRFLPPIVCFFYKVALQIIAAHRLKLQAMLQEPVNTFCDAAAADPDDPVQLKGCTV